jgi:hypothetical protein
MLCEYFIMDKVYSKRVKIKRDPDKIWRSRECEYQGLLAFIHSLDRINTRVLLIAHFADTLHEIEQQLRTENLSFRTYTTIFEGHLLRTVEEYQSPDCILLARASALPERLPKASYPTSSWGFDIDLLVIEHHPFASYDDHIMGFAQSLPCMIHVGFYESLDSDFMRHYGGMKASQLMTAMDLPGNEYIASPMIDNAIRKAQKRISGQVVNPIMADTAEEWFQKNYSGDT